MELHIGFIKISISFFDIIGFDDDYFIPRFNKEMSKDRIVESSSLGTAFDSYIVLEYEDMNDLMNLNADIEAIKRVLIRNKKRLIERSEKNERKVMNVQCTIGGICDDWINKK